MSSAPNKHQRGCYSNVLGAGGFVNIYEKILGSFLHDINI